MQNYILDNRLESREFSKKQPDNMVKKANVNNMDRDFGGEDELLEEMEDYD